LVVQTEDIREGNIKWIGRSVAEIWRFDIFQHGGWPQFWIWPNGNNRSADFYVDSGHDT